MTTIARIKAYLDYETGKERQEFYPYAEFRRAHIALLVEYYEAAEGELHYLGTSGDTQMSRRLKQARLRLEEEDGS